MKTKLFSLLLFAVVLSFALSSCLFFPSDNGSSESSTEESESESSSESLCSHTYNNACDTSCNSCGATRSVDSHVYDNACDVDCNVCGATRSCGDHFYNNACDTDCNECGAIRTTEHRYSGDCDADCNVCNAIRTTDAPHTHTDTDGYCDVCRSFDDAYTTGGIVFELSHDESYYIAVDYDEAYSAVIIPATYKGKPVKEIGERAFVHYSNGEHGTLIENSTLTQVTIGKNIEKIGEGAFWYCAELSECILPASLKTIDPYAFYICKKLRSITIPNGVTEIPEAAFGFCEKLISISIPPSVTRIGKGAFTYCPILEYCHIEDVSAFCRISFEDGDAYPLNSWCRLYLNGAHLTGDIILEDGITEIPAYTFAEATVTSITVPSSVQRIGDYAFHYCKNLVSITIPGSVTEIGKDAFSACTSLSQITVAEDNIVYKNIDGNHLYTKDGKTLVRYAIGNSATSLTVPGTVHTIEECAFSSCKALVSVTLPDSVESIKAFAFYGCSALASISLGSSVAVIGNDAFGYCEKLVSVTIPDSVTEIGDRVFLSCTSLSQITVGEGNTVYKSIDGNHLYTKDGKTLVQYAIGNTATNFDIPETVTAISEYAFCYSASLASVAIPNSVTEIGQYAFSACDALTVYADACAQPSGWDAEWNPQKRPVVWERNHDYGEAGLICETCGIHYYTEGLSFSSKSGGYAVTNYTGSTDSVIIPALYNGLPVTRIEEGAFSNCTALVSVAIPDSVTEIGRKAFSGCTALTSITIPNSVTSIGYSAFLGCNRIESMTLPLRVCLPDRLFWPGNNANLSNGHAPASLKTLVITLPEGETAVFNGYLWGCPYLESVTIPEGVTALGSSLGYCGSLKKVTLPSTLTSIDDYSFDNSASNIEIHISDLAAWAGVSVPFGFMQDKTLHLNGDLVEGAFVIPEGTAKVGSNVFSRYDRITSVTLPSSVESIGGGAFRGCQGLSAVYYYGTEAEWNEVSVETGASSFLPSFDASACIYYYTETEPTEAGNFWHYDENGVPVIWGAE